MEDILNFDFESFLREEEEKTLKREELNHSKISEESDRGAIIVAAALLDDALRAKICKRLFDCSTKKDPLFDDGNAPLGTFAAKIELAFRLGEIDEECKKLSIHLKNLGIVLLTTLVLPHY